MASKIPFKEHVLTAEESLRERTGRVAFSKDEIRAQVHAGPDAKSLPRNANSHITIALNSLVKDGVLIVAPGGKDTYQRAPGSGSREGATGRDAGFHGEGQGAAAPPQDQGAISSTHKTLDSAAKPSQPVSQAPSAAQSTSALELQDTRNRLTDVSAQLVDKTQEAAVLAKSLDEAKLAETQASQELINVQKTLDALNTEHANLQRLQAKSTHTNSVLQARIQDLERDLVTAQKQLREMSSARWLPEWRENGRLTGEVAHLRATVRDLNERLDGSSDDEEDDVRMEATQLGTTTPFSFNTGGGGHFGGGTYFTLAPSGLFAFSPPRGVQVPPVRSSPVPVPAGFVKERRLMSSRAERNSVLVLCARCCTHPAKTNKGRTTERPFDDACKHVESHQVKAEDISDSDLLWHPPAQ